MIDDYDESSGWMFLLVPAHPGFPGQIPQSRKTVVCVVCVYGINWLFWYLLFWCIFSISWLFGVHFDIFAAFRCIGDWSNQWDRLCNFSKVTFVLVFTFCVLSSSTTSYIETN